MVNGYRDRTVNRTEARTPRGRTREFDIGVAVDRALPVFWAHGYDGATLAELSGAMSLQRGSVYAAFGSKEELFERVLARYAETVGSYVARAVARDTIAGVAEEMLRGCVHATTGADTPRGCMIVHGALSTSAESEPVRERLARVRRDDETALRTRFEQLGADDPAGLAGLVTALTAGLSVKARSGVQADELHRIVDLALAVLPLGPTAG